MTDGPEPPRRRRRWPRRVLRGVVVLVLVGYVGINAFGDWYIARNQRGHEPESSPATVGLSFEDVRYDGKLRAWWIPAASGKPVIVVVHGSGSNRSGPLPEAAGLHRRGYPLLLISLGYVQGRPFGGGQRETKEIGAAIAYARRRVAGPVVLLGYSAGGFAVSAAAARGVDARAVISDSGFVDFQSNSTDHSGIPRPVFSLMAPLYPLFSNGGHLVDVATAVPRDYHTPTLIIQGTADSEIKVGQARHLARALHGQLWIVPGVGHTATYSVMPEAYLDRIDAFLAAA